LYRYWSVVAAVPLLCVATSLPAQLAPLGAPKGALRFEVGGTFQSADHRFLAGQTEDYLADFGSPSFGSNRIGLLVSADSFIGRVLGQPGYRLNLGAERAHGQLTIGTGTIGAALGVTRRLTLFIDVPFVTKVVQANLRNDSTNSEAGLNPAHPTLGDPTDRAAAAAFFLSNRIASGGYTGPDSVLAVQTLDRGQQVRDALFGLTSDPGRASPYIPTATSTSGQAILTTVRDLQNTITTTLGVSGTGFSTDPVLASSRLTDDQFIGSVTDPNGPFATFPLIEGRVSRMGDIDVGAIYTVVDRFDQHGRKGGLRLALSGVLRLPTGIRSNPNDLLDVGTGNGRYEIGGYGTADLGAGAVGARLTGGYLARLPARRARRVGDLGSPYVTFDMLTNVRENVGDVMTLGARPFLRLASRFALLGLVDYTRVGADVVSYNSPLDAIPGIPAGVLANGKRTSLAIGGGVTYVGRAVHECEPDHRCGWPIDAWWNYSTVISATGGRVIKYRTTTLGIRWYQRLWR
jgi:hypothetical protein